jgi:surfactin synthase thioesterase subunit
MVRLILLHHAGGSRLNFRGWRRWLPGHWEILAPDAPGRGLRYDVPPVRDIDALVDYVLGETLAGLDGPLAIFGHSMGAAVAAALTNRLLAGAGPAPAWLGVSGWDAQRSDDVDELTDELTDDELRARLLALGGTQTELLTDPGYWRLLAPLLRADLAVMAGHEPDANRDWLDVPLSVFGGRSDAIADPDRLTALAGAARRLVGLHLYPGGHFYLNHRTGDVARQIAADVLAATYAMTLTKEP